MMTQIERRPAPPTAEFGGRFKKGVPIDEAMLHLKPRFKVKEDFDAHRGALEKDWDLGLAHSLLREARRASEAEPG
jgi:hypothetical protein